MIYRIKLITITYLTFGTSVKFLPLIELRSLKQVKVVKKRKYRLTEILMPLHFLMFNWYFRYIYLGNSKSVYNQFLIYTISL